MSNQYVFKFGGDTADGSADMKNLLGGKGANLAEMARLGIPVPAGFTITTEMCTVYYKMDCNYPPELVVMSIVKMAFFERVVDGRDRRIKLATGLACNLFILGLGFSEYRQER